MSVLHCSYNEAQKIKLKADALEAWELEKWKNQKQQEMLQREVTFKQRQRQDLDALLKRIQSGREEQKKQRQVDLERFVVFQCWSSPNTTYGSGGANRNLMWTVL